MKKGGQLTVAIDGASSTGKSTLARQLADTLGYSYIDSGAMYRAVTYYFIQNGVALNDPSGIKKALESVHLTFQNKEGQNRTLLNGTDVSHQIRSIEVSDMVSEVAALSVVRRKLVSEQKKMGAEGGIVMDGRDIGTVVFPDADIKIFLKCNLENRVNRRYQELINKNVDISKKDVRENLLHRDEIDSTRIDSPLRPAEDAVFVDNSHLTLQETVQKCLSLIKERMRDSI